MPCVALLYRDICRADRDEIVVSKDSTSHEVLRGEVSVGHKMPWIYPQNEVDCPETLGTDAGKQPMKVLKPQSFREAPRHAQKPGHALLVSA